MKPLHSVCGPGLERDTEEGAGVAGGGDGRSQSPTHQPPTAAVVLFLSSDPHSDLATPLERFVQAAANIQDRDSGDPTSRAPKCSFIWKGKNKMGKTEQIPCCWLVTVPIPGLLTASGRHL